jgi:gas vesicle protein
MAKNAKYILAGIVGALAGAVGGLLLAPKSGKETRQEIVNLANKITESLKSRADETKERVKDVYGKYSEEALEKYQEVKSGVISKLAAVKSAGQDIDKEKYGMVVENVVGEYKDDLKSTKDGLNKLVSYFKKDWAKVKKAL